jgi:hypothetical protein
MLEAEDEQEDGDAAAQWDKGNAKQQAGAK